MTLNADYVFAEAHNTRSIIDTVRPDGRSSVYGHTLDEVRERYPSAELMTWDEWQNRAIVAQQAVALDLRPIDAEAYDDALNVLPPMDWRAGAFLVPEAVDHDMATGAPRYDGYIYRAGHHYVTTRPVTRVEFADLVAGRDSL